MKILYKKSLKKKHKSTKSKKYNIEKIRKIVSNNTKKIGQGGQSKIYKYNNNSNSNSNNNKIIRTIENNIYEFEISRIISNIAKNSNCINLMELIEDYDNSEIKFQILKKYDGDYSKISNNIDIININKCNFQMLIACILLTINKLINFDIKPENVLFKYNDKPYKLIYKINDKEFLLETNYLITMADYGKVLKFEDIINNNEIINTLISTKSKENCTILTNLNNLQNLFKEKQIQLFINDDRLINEIELLKKKIINFGNLIEVNENINIFKKWIVKHIYYCFSKYYLKEIKDNEYKIMNINNNSKIINLNNKSKYNNDNYETIYIKVFN